HLVCGEVSYILPCLGRIERDDQANGPQIVTTEDSTTCIHASFGKREPASDQLRSEPAIVAAIAKAALQPNPKVPWDEWVGDYSKVRDAIESTYPTDFRDFNQRMHQAGGFPRSNAARERIWKTASGKAEFCVPELLNATGFVDNDTRLRLITLRSNDQFNTTVYGYRDRFRGIEGTRRVVLMNSEDIARLGLTEGEQISLVSDADDGVHREVGGLRIVPYRIPLGCIGAYYPECNPLMPVAHHAKDSHVPAAKSV